MALDRSFNRGDLHASRQGAIRCRNTKQSVNRWSCAGSTDYSASRREFMPAARSKCATRTWSCPIRSRSRARNFRGVEEHHPWNGRSAVLREHQYVPRSLRRPRVEEANARASSLNARSLTAETLRRPTRISGERLQVIPGMCCCLNEQHCFRMAATCCPENRAPMPWSARQLWRGGSSESGIKSRAVADSAQPV
jgi:hypothetical protein